jgi:hypothetical protein
MLTIFNLIILTELLLITGLFAFSWHQLWLHWRTTAAGLFVIGVILLINGIIFCRTGGILNTIDLAQFLAIGIAFLLAADGEGQ